MMNTPETDTTNVQLIQQNTAQADIAPTLTVQESSTPTEFQKTFFLSECTILHDEINARMAQRGNLFTFTIITAGTLLSLGATTQPQIALFYPVLSLFLAAAWSDEDGKIGALGAYLHDQEVRYDLDGWSSYHRVSRQKPRLWLGGLQRFYPKSLLGLATRGVFLSTQLLAILVAVDQVISKANSAPKNADPWGALVGILPLLCVAIVAMLITAFIIQHKRNHTLEREQRGG